MPIGRGMGALVPADVRSRLINQQQPASSSASSAGQTLRQKAADAEALFKSIAGRSLAMPDQSPASSNGAAAPWIDPPEGFESLPGPSSIVLPAADDADYVVLSYRVPSGWDGVVKQVAHIYTGPRQVLGTGYLTWRIFRNGNPVKGFDAIQVPYGGISSNGSVVTFDLGAGFRGFSNELITYVVKHSSTSTLPAGAAYIVCFIGGGVFPQGGPASRP